MENINPNDCPVLVEFLSPDPIDEVVRRADMLSKSTFHNDGVCPYLLLKHDSSLIVHQPSQFVVPAHKVRGPICLLLPESVSLTATVKLSPPTQGVRVLDVPPTTVLTGSASNSVFTQA